MVDVDGVVVRRPDGRGWDADLEHDLGIRAGDLQRLFFGRHFEAVLDGEADLYDRLDEVLPALGPVRSSELVEYWFAHDATLDQRLLTDLADARAQGFDAQLATVQEHHRARYLWETLGLRSSFSAMHYAADVGFRKTDAEFYAVVGARTGLPPELHCPVDDSAANVDAARAAGWAAFRWEPGSTLAEVLASLHGPADPPRPAGFAP